VRSLFKGAQRTLAAVFERAKVASEHPHRFRRTFASEIPGKGGPVIEPPTPAFSGLRYTG
jgi:integrase